LEGLVSDFFHTVGKDDGRREFLATIEGIFPDLCQVTGDSDGRQAGATSKGPTVDYFHVIGDGDGRQAGAILESAPFNGCLCDI